MRLSVLAAVSLSVPLFLSAGCAASASDVSPGSADLTAAAPPTPITLGNFLRDPRIVAIRAEVTAIDAATMTSTSKDATCPPGEKGSLDPSTRAKKVDASGAIRRLDISWQNEAGNGNTTYYYDAGEHLRFVLDFADVTYEGAKTPGNRWSSLYFDASGTKLFEVVQLGRQDAPYALPNPDGSPPTDPVFLDPEALATPAALYDAPVCPIGPGD